MKTVLLIVSLLALSTMASAAALDCTLTSPTGVIGANVTSLSNGCFGGGLLFDSFSVSSAPPGTNVFNRPWEQAWSRIRKALVWDFRS